MSVTELRAVGRELEADVAPSDRKEDLVDRILQLQTERAGLGLRHRHPDNLDEGFGFMRRHGLLPESGGRVRQARARCARYRACASATVCPAPSARRARARSTGSDPASDSVNGVDGRRHAAARSSTTSHRPPGRPSSTSRPIRRTSRSASSTWSPRSARASARSSSARPRPARRCSSRTSPTHLGELPRDPPDGRPDRRAPGGGHDMRRSVKARSSARRSTNRPRTTPTSPRWRWRSPSARSRPARRRDPARLDHAPGARLQPGAAAVRRTLSVPPTPIALYPPKRFFGAARNIERAGR